MNKKKRVLQEILILAVIVIGVYMWWNHPWGSPPALSGVGFFLAGVAMWIPHCPVCKMLLKD